MTHKYFTLLLALFMGMVSGAVSAHDFEVDGIYYHITSDTTVAVTFRGSSSTSYSNHYTGSVTIPELVTYSEQTYSVTSIGEQAFRNCSGLTSLTIPNSVTSIGASAFEVCTSLTSVTNGSGVTSIGDYAFYCCVGLTSDIIPECMTIIGSAAFAYCRGLTSLTIPESVTAIGSAAFSNCTSLTTIVVEGGNTTYDSRNHCNAIIETASNTLIAGCMNTVIPESVTSIGGYAFYGCSGPTSVAIPGSVTSIGDHAFSGCRGMASLTIPASVTAIGISAFRNCANLTTIVVESGNTTYDSRNHCNAIIETASNTLIAGCMNTVIPNSVTSIGDYAFYNCGGLTSVTIPGSVTTIGSSVFSGCDGLTSVTVAWDTPISIDSYTFTNRTNATLYVPKGTYAAYMAARYWKDFKEKIEYEGETGVEPMDNGQLTMDHDGAVYDLGGRRISLHDNANLNGTLKKGIYIVNGRRVLVRSASR